jgi:hypothetical protein
MDKYYGNVCELDIIFNFQKAYFILDELLLAGEMQESSKKNVLRTIGQQDSLEDMEVGSSFISSHPEEHTPYIHHLQSHTDVYHSAFRPKTKGLRRSCSPRCWLIVILQSPGGSIANKITLGHAGRRIHTRAAATVWDNLKSRYRPCNEYQQHEQMLNF